MQTSPRRSARSHKSCKTKISLLVQQVQQRRRQPAKPKINFAEIRLESRFKKKSKNKPLQDFHIDPTGGRRGPQVELDPLIFTRKAPLQTRSSTASKNPCHLPGDRERGREAVPLTPILTHKAPIINSQPALKSHVLLAISFIKIRACPTHPSFSGAVAAAHFVCFNSAASAKRRGQHMPPCI